MSSINHPLHYADTCSIECIDAMELIFSREEIITICMANAFKYLWRWKHKNGYEDLEKARWYLSHAQKLNHKLDGNVVYLSLTNKLSKLAEMLNKAENEDLDQRKEKR